MRGWLDSLRDARAFIVSALVLLALAFALVLGRWLAIIEAPLTRHAVGRSLLENGAPDQAAHLFEAPLWKGVALYRAERFHRSVGAFVTDDSVTGLYNMGNAYARLGLYRGAATAYEAVLRRQPTHEDANFNLELVRAAERRAQELELESRETENAGNWEDGLRDQGKEGEASNETGEEEGGNEENQASEPPEDASGEQEADGGATDPLTSEAETTGQGTGGSEQENEMADAATFSLSGKEDQEADDLRPNESEPNDSEVLGGVTERAREEAIADQILLRRIADDPALVLKARLNMALRRQRAK